MADECHRGYSAKDQAIWRETLDYFDAIKIGLTATPAAHTMAYFENLAYRYDYETAVREGYLVDYDVVRVRSDVRINGVSASTPDSRPSVCQSRSCGCTPSMYSPFGGVEAHGCSDITVGQVVEVVPLVVGLIVSRTVDVGKVVRWRQENRLDDFELDAAALPALGSL